MIEGWSKVTLQEVCLPVDNIKRKNKSPDDKLIYLDIGGIDNEKNRIVDYKTYLGICPIESSANHRFK